MAPTSLQGNLVRERREPEILGVEQTETLFRSRFSRFSANVCPRRPTSPTLYACVITQKRRKPGDNPSKLLMAACSNGPRA